MAEAAEIGEDRIGVGLRLKAARTGCGLTQADVAARFGLNKATVSAWETGRGSPDAITLRALAKLYNVSADAILWENSLSPAAMKIASEYDHLTERQQRTWQALWLAYISATAAGGELLPAAPSHNSTTR